MTESGGSLTAYDRLGFGYAGRRRPDPRIATQLLDALGTAGPVVNVGAGSGSYEPAHLAVIAVEPSTVMLGQRPPGSAPAVRAVAEKLPFADGHFAAGMAVLTVHHWADIERGLAEMRRVVRGRIVVLTWDQAVFESFWMVSDDEVQPGLQRLERRVPAQRSPILDGLARVRVMSVIP